MPSFEVALPLGAIAFYLYDSIVLLNGNELIFIQRGGRWRADGGFDLFLFGKRLGVPAPLLPASLLFRVAWAENDTRGDAALHWPPLPFQKAVAPLKWMCSILLIMLVLLLPPISIALGAGALLLGLFAVFYLTILLALVIVYRHREALRLQGAAFWSLALDVVACPPFAVNLVRKLSLRYGLEGNPLAFAKSHFEAPEQGRLIATVGARVDEFLAREQEGSENARALAAFRDRL